MLTPNEFKKCQKEYDKVIVAIKKGNKKREKLQERMNKLAHKGFPPACLFMRAVFLNGEEKATSEEDKKKFMNAANNLLKMAADNGDVGCQYTVAKMYEQGKGFLQNDREAFRYYLLAARNGDRTAQTNVGRYYSLGIGVEQNATEYIYWNTQAANNGESIAMNNMGNAYENGKGVTKDNALAREWYHKALANAKHLIETEGAGRPEYLKSNEEKAIKLAEEGLKRMEIQTLAEEYRQMQSDYLKEITEKKLQRYAEEGEWRAQFEMGLIHANRQNYEEAIRWYQMAADNGSSGAMRNIGMFYYYGQGRPVDYHAAYDWFMSAIHCAANTHAMFLVGEMFEKGLYVDKNIQTAISWYQKAKRQGSTEAKKRLQNLGIE